MPRRNRLRVMGTAASGAVLLVLAFSTGARAATVDHFSIGNAVVTEGDAGTVAITFAISYVGPLNNISVDWATANGSAVAGADYVAASGTATFVAAGPRTQNITVQVMGDLLNEVNETFTVNLTNAQPPATADITTATGTGTITDNDPLPSIVINDVSVTEGNAGTTNADFTVTLSAPSGRAVNVTATAANGTATKPADYSATTTNLVFIPGQVTQTVSVPVVGDVLDEIDETFAVNLTSPTNATIADNQGIGTILDDDPAPSLSINDIALTEGNAGTSNMTFTVTLSAASGKTVTVDYATADGTATSPADYTVAAATLTFNPGVLTRTFTVPIVGDTIDEFDETFVVNLTNPGNATIADNQGIGTITDNDPLPTLAFANVTVVEGDVGTVNATFTVTLSAASGKTVTVDYATADGTATSPADYTATSGTLTFAPGQTTKTIDVPIVGDVLNEANETYTLTLSNPLNGTVPTATRTGTITDNDPLPTIVINDVSVSEGNAGTTNATFTLTLSAPSGRAVTVRATTANGTATQPADYTSTNIVLTFPAGTTTQSYVVPVVGDTLDEADDTFFVNLTTPTNSTIADAQGVGTILDDDPLPTITINDVSRVEGNAGTANLNFTVTLSPVSGRTVTVDYTTADASAVAPADYTAVSGTTTFNAGTTSRTISVPIVGDTLDEFDETLVVNLTNPGNATISDNQGVGTITDNDPLPTVDVSNVAVSEGDSGTTTATFTVSLSAASGKPIAVDYATADGTALTPADYAGTTGTLSFSAGQTMKTVDVTIQGDVLDEFDETFSLGVSNLVNVAPGIVTGTGTITDDDPLPTVSVGDLSIPEGDAGTTTASLTVSLSAPSGKPITVDWTTADGTAVAPADYAGASGTLSFAPGQITKTVNVDISGDVTYENDETLTLALSNPVNVALGGTPATVTIQNDDPLPQISIDDRSVTEGDVGTTSLTFTVSLTNPSAFPVTVDYATSDGSAVSSADYGAVSTTVSFAPGESSKTVDVSVAGDTLDEPDETFTSDLTNPVGATISDNQGIGTILDDDASPVVSIDDQSVTEGDVGTTTATFTVSLSAPSGKPISVDYASADGTGLAPADYTASSGTLSFAPGQTTKTIDMAIQGDVLDEFDETFTLGLSNLVNVAPGTVTGTGTITDDDPLPTVSVADVSRPEGDAGIAQATFTISLSAPSGKPISVDYTTADGTADASDYTGISGALSFAPGQTSKILDVDISGDTIYENDETFSFGLSSLVNVAAGTVVANGTIRNDDPLPSVSIDDVAVAEGNSGTSAATFTISLTNPSAFPGTVDYATADGTAVAPGDYGSVSTTVSFAPGETSKTVDVLVVGDDVYEMNEAFTVDLTNPVGATIADAQGTATIVDDDAVPVLSIGDATVAEGDAGDVTASFPVTLTGATQLPVTVDVATADGTAIAGSDYAGVSTTLTFVPGETLKTVDVVVHGDTTFELGETFTVQLSNASGATIGSSPAVGTILNDDSTPGLVVTDVSVPEGNAGDTIATFTVAMGAPSAFPVTVDATTQDGTATQPTDYDSVASSLTFAPGETAKTVDVVIHGDTVVEPNETFTMQLSNVIGAGITDGVGLGVIVDDDALAPPPAPPTTTQPVASIGDASTDEGSSGTTTILTFPVTLSDAPADAVTVDYRTSDGSATQGSDYRGTAGTLRFASGETSGSIQVTVIGDNRVEPDETFALQVTGSSGAGAGSGGTGTILNDDRVPTRLTLHVHIHGHGSRLTTDRIMVRGRLIDGSPDQPIRVVLMRRHGSHWVVVARTTARTMLKAHPLHSGDTGFGYRSAFRVDHGGRYRVRAVFRGDALLMPTRAHRRFRI